MREYHKLPSPPSYVDYVLEVFHAENFAQDLSFKKTHHIKHFRRDYKQCKCPSREDEQVAYRTFKQWNTMQLVKTVREFFPYLCGKISL
jgi:hypothetical protein